MPQLNPTSFSSQLFWLTVSFVALYMLLARFLLPRVKSLLEMRAKTIEDDVKQADGLRSQAERVSEQYEKALADAREKSQAMLAAAQEEIAARAAKRQAELGSSIEKKLAESDAAIKSARKEVADKLTPVAGELTSLIVEALVHQKPSPKDIGAVISGLSKEPSA